MATSHATHTKHAKKTSKSKDANATQTYQPQDQSTQAQQPQPTFVTLLSDIREAVTIKHNAVFALTDPTGDIAKGPNAQGIYFRDMCFLDQLEMHINDHKMVGLLSDAGQGTTSVFELTNPVIKLGDGKVIPKERLGIRREYRIHDVITAEIRVQNNDAATHDLDLTLTFGSHFLSIFTIRGTPPGKRGTLHPPENDGKTLTFVYDGADGHRRTTAITCDPPPAAIEGGTLRYHLHLPHGTPQKITTLHIALADDAPSSQGGMGDRITPGAQSEQHHQMREAIARTPEITSDNPLFDAALHRSLDDMQMLVTSSHGDTYVAAGIPWYVALFGRDSCISAYEMLALQPELAASTLRVLAHYQATEHNDFQDAEPGKILHELRVGEMANLREIPQIPYYGTVDATPWFLILLDAYVQWTGDLDLYRELRDNVDRALEWIDANLHHSASGFLEYGSRSSKGLANQGWKDSGNSIVNTDGSLAQPPIALVEVQGYVYAALRGIARCERLVDDDLHADHLERRAADFQRHFNEHYWMAREGFYALAIERDNRLVQSIASNAGQTLFTGIPDPDKAASVAQRVVQDDMFSGWGVRTLSADETAYNPLDYQVGSVWPHDNALIALGLHRTGHIDQAQKIFSGIFDAATNFDHYRLPEVFDGFARARYARPVHYPVACRPQAWAAGALPLLLTAALGLFPDAHHHTLRIRHPALPPWLHTLTVRHLRLGAARIDLHYEQSDGMTLVGVLGCEGDARVVIEA